MVNQQKKTKVAKAEKAKDIIKPSFAHYIPTQTEEVKLFFNSSSSSSSSRQMPPNLFPSSATYIGDDKFRVWFHGRTEHVVIPLKLFDERYHACLFRIMHNGKRRSYSVYSDSDNAIIVGYISGSSQPCAPTEPKSFN